MAREDLEKEAFEYFYNGFCCSEAIGCFPVGSDAVTSSASIRTATSS